MSGPNNNAPNGPLPFDVGPQQTLQTPAICLSGSTVDRMVQSLSVTPVFVRAQNGSLVGLADPSLALAVLRDAAMAEAKRLGLVRVGESGEAIMADPSTVLMEARSG